MDSVDQAIAAADQRTTITLIEVPVQISSTGRPVILQVPPDLSDVEIIELAGFLLISLRPFIAQRLRSSSPIIVPRS